MNDSPDLLPADPLALVDPPDAERLVRLKKSARWQKAREGKFPAPLTLSQRCVRYRAGDLRRWLEDPLGWRPEYAIDYRPQAESTTRRAVDAQPADSGKLGAAERVLMERKHCAARSVPVAELPPELQRSLAAHRKSSGAA